MKGNNIKNTLWVLLTTAIVILGALLPGILARLQEGSLKPGYAAMNSVELNLHSDNAQFLQDAISLVSNSINTLAVSEDVTAHTEAEILELAQALLQPYLEQDLILASELDVKSMAYSCIPYLTVSDDGQTASSAVFWEVLILFDEEEPALRLGIEDQTGALVALDYHSSKTDAAISGVDYFIPNETMQTLCYLYLEGLGSKVTAPAADDISNAVTSDGVYAQHWSFRWEGSFGPAGISFDVWPNGITVSYF